MQTWTKIALILTIVGALNWLLIGFFNWNVIGSIFGEKTGFTRFIYAIIGLAGIWLIVIYGKLLLLS